MRDWRTWTGLAVTLICVAFALRGVEPGEVGRGMAGADWIWVALMPPFSLLGMFVRGVRWRYLLLPLAPEPLRLRALFDATLVGFAVNNLLPLRIGELARPWFLSRHTGVSASAALGTLLLERAIDFTCVLALGAAVLLGMGESVPPWVRRSADLLALLAALPFLFALALRLDEPRTLRLLARLVRPLPPRIGAPALELATELCRGLRALRGGRATLAVAFWSVVFWGVVCALPYGLGLLAFGIALSPRGLLLATYTVTVFTSLAVAAPAAPGFFGVWHFACREALARFGVPAPIGVAYGTVLHLAYWVPVTLGGLYVMLRAGTRLAQLPGVSLGKAASGPLR